MEVEERQEIQEDQLQLVQSSTTGSFYHLEQGVPTTEQHLPAEYENGGYGQQENLEFWRSLGVDVGNMPKRQSCLGQI